MFKKALISVAIIVATSNTAMAADGQAIVEKACQACHAAGVANAPKIGDKAAWDARKAKGIDALISSVKNGLNAMPPGGMCTDCSDDDYKAAIAHMSK
jgi:cytochrome c5